MDFELVSDFKPTGDQPEAIRQLTEGLNNGERHQVLLGVTGSGKTFTMANIIANVNKPTLILTHNKTLVAQLYGEFRQFFPNNAVEYFVSYYDYYQPEAYLPVSDTYIEKDLNINEQIEKLRLRATTSLLSGRRDVIVVASVSCIYGMGNPMAFKQAITGLKKGEQMTRNKLLFKLVDSLYSRTTAALQSGTFRVSGDTVDIYPPYMDAAFRVYFWGDEIESMEIIDPNSGKSIQKRDHISIFPANLFVTNPDVTKIAIREIQDDMVAQVEYFNQIGKFLESKRLDERVNFDLEMIRELGYCSGIENYSRYFDRREPGTRPFCLLDYFPDEKLIFLDESHQSVPQVRGMYAGDRARKQNLVEYGFRLPAALDNRPLKFDEFEGIIDQVIYVSATPGEYELKQTEGVVVEQVIRPTGLLDPVIEIRPCQNQIDDLLEEIDERVKAGDRVLVTTLTKRMSEELQKYLTKFGIKCRYIHSEVETLERVEILRDLRLGVFDVLIGINLLREGLDLPEVSLVAILDADKEGFLRSDTSLTQTAGRAARNVNGKVIMYADKITGSMQRTIDTTNRRREKQIAYNEAHGITPKTILKSREQILQQTSIADSKENKDKTSVRYDTGVELAIAADPVVEYMTEKQLQKAIEKSKSDMMKAAKNMEFTEAARLRDEMFALQTKMKEKFGVEV
ncbi:MAG: excinuclease ABC subunit UvrB [Bacteroidia bacterium]